LALLSGARWPCHRARGAPAACGIRRGAPGAVVFLLLAGFEREKKEQKLPSPRFFTWLQ
jgi:hypothetical protein